MSKTEIKQLIADFEERIQTEFSSLKDRTKPWTVKEYCEEYGCTEPTVYGMLNRGDLKAFYIGKGTSSIRITPASVIKNDESRKYVPRENHNPVKSRTA